MQKKFGTILDEELLNLAKQKAQQQKTTLNHILEEALAEYLLRRQTTKQKLSTVEATFGAMKLPLKKLRQIAQEDIYEA